MTVLKDEFIKARKQHTCSLCYGKIKPGEIYIYQFIVDNGESWSFKSHPRCLDLAVELDAYNDDGYSPVHLYEAVVEELSRLLVDKKLFEEAVEKSLYEMINLYLDMRREPEHVTQDSSGDASQKG